MTMFRHPALTLARLTDLHKDSFQNNFSRENVMKSPKKLILTSKRKEQKKKKNMSNKVIRYIKKKPAKTVLNHSLLSRRIHLI